MKTSYTAVFGAISVFFILFTSNEAYSQQSGISQEEAISILQKAPGGDNLIFAGGDSRWQGRATEMVNGSETAYISTVEVHGTKVYVGGEFTSINTIEMNNVGVYDLENGTWSPLTATIATESFNGVSGRVNTIEAINNDIFIGGSFIFNHPIDGTFSHIVRYNTVDASFYGLRYGDDSSNGVSGGYPYKIVAVESQVKSISEVSNGGPYYTLYVGGSFTSAGGEAAPYIAKFTYNVDGWEPLHESVELDDPVNDILVNENVVYFGGQFNSAGNVPNTRNIAAFNVFTSTLSSVGGGITESGTVYAIEKIGDNLYVGGSNITQAGGSVSFNNLARFNLNTNTWSGLATNFTGGIYAMTTLGDKLYVGGIFGQVTNDIQSRGFAYLNTTNDTWVGAGTGVSNTSTAYINGMAVFSGEVNSVQQDFVFVGGGFTTAGGSTAANVASWDAESYIPGAIELQSPDDMATAQSLTPTLAWQEDSKANSYVVQISTSSEFEVGNVVYTKTGIVQEIVNKSADLDTFIGVEHTVETNLDYFKQYHWRVRGVGDDGEGEWSTARQFRAQAGSPTKTAPADEATSVSVTPTFRIVTNDFIAQNFKLKVSTNADLSEPVILETIGYPGKAVGEINDAQESTFTPETPLSHNTRYYWNAIGLEANGDEGAANDTISFLTMLSTPTLNLPGNNQNNQVVLPTFQWNSVTGADQYRIQISTSNEFTEGSTTEIVYNELPQKGAEINNGFFEYTLEEEYELEYITQYYWRVRGEFLLSHPKQTVIQDHTVENTGEWSEPFNFTTQVPIPAQVALTSPSDGATGQPIRPTFDWEPVEYANWYYLEIYDNAEYSGDAVYTKDEIFDPNRSVGKSAGDDEIAVDVAEFPFTVDADLNNATTYYWRVRGRNNTGNGDWSVSRGFTTTWATPGLVTLVSPSDGSGDVSLTPTMTWQETSDATMYDLEVSTSSDFTNRVAIVYEETDLRGDRKAAGITTVENFEHAIPADVLDYDTEYYWRVLAKNPDLTGEWATPWSFRTIWPVPGVASLLTPASEATGVAVLPTFTWERVTYGSQYEIQVWTNNTETGDPVYEKLDIPGIELKSTGGNVSDVTNIEHTITTELNNNTVYHWRVRAKNNTGEGEWTAFREFTTIWAAPGVVTRISPSDGTLERQPLRPTLSWQPASDAVYYDVQIATTMNFAEGDIVYEREDLMGPAKSVGEVAAVAIDHEVELALAHNTTHYWRVRGKNPDFQETNYNDEPWSFTTIVAAPGQVTNLITPEEGATGVAIRPEFSWTNIDFAEEYDLRVWDNESMTGDPVYTASGIVVAGKSDAAEISNGVTVGHLATQDLQNNTEYFWQVLAKNTTGDGDWSALSDFTTTWAAPGVVTLVSPVDGSTGESVTPTLSWLITSNTTQYNLEVSTSSDFTDRSSIVYEQANLGALKTAGFSTVENFEHAIPVDVLDNNTQYFWRVRATNPDVNGDWSATWDFTTIVALPSQVTLSSPANGAEDVTRGPSLIWNTVDGAVSYEFEMDTSEAFDVNSESFVRVPEATGTQVTFGGDQLLANTRYFWRVRARNAAGLGEWSAVWSFTTELGVPVQVSLLSPNNGETDVALVPKYMWSPLEEVLSYHLQVSSNENFTDPVVDKTGIEQTSYTSEVKLSGQSTYFYRVRARNIQGYGEWSVIRPFTTTTDVPGVVFVLSPNNNEENVDFKPRFEWNLVDGATLYQLQVDDDKDFGSTVIDRKGIESDEYMADIFLRGLKKYYYRVRARNSVGFGEWSVVRPFTTKPATIPGKVSNLLVRQITTKQVVSKTHSVQSTAAFEISWTPPAFDGGTEIVDYRIVYRKTDETSWTTYEREASTDTVAIVTGFESGVAYAFDVLAVNAVGVPEPTDDPPVVVSIETEEVPDQVTLMQNYPNPFNPATTIRFSLPVSSEVRLEVYSMLGQRLAVLAQGQQPAGWHTVTLDATSWASGTYIYRLQIDGFTQTKKFLLVK